MALRRLNNQSPNSYAALARELKAGEELVVTYKGRSTTISSQRDITTKVAPMLRDKNVRLSDVSFQAKS
ncbi:MAG TPA: hypothetical protein VL481_02355 [Verrucomicrobiae bacterium]|nr:hypothetical protein [Verrucomicrobiae bacterium]